ncbi:hypothetical protein [Mycolicibacterium aubagnense]|uniref:hypothetical protein n=1 Tax=Mycolicibacterium aubagnense TaxID=319707 RepID=UPI0010FEB881|nr:hypothetical protein [Mycolicibacterium aubagnense]
MRRTALFDTVEHAALTALTAAIDACTDRVRRQSSRAMFALITLSGSGDGAPARGQAGAVVALIETAIEANPSIAPMMLAFERWLMHPVWDTAEELTTAAGIFVSSASEELCRRAWLSGAGLNAAVDAVSAHGLRDAPPEALSLIRVACSHGIPVVWVAQRCWVVRDGLYRRIRTADPDAWTAMAAE